MSLADSPVDVPITVEDLQMLVATKGSKEETPHGWVRRGDRFSPCHDVLRRLPPGCYTAFYCSDGMALAQHPYSTDGVWELDQAWLRELCEDTGRFWESKEAYAKLGLPHKRGILLYGPPGCGKSCAIKLMASQVLDRGGIVLWADRASLLADTLKHLHDIQPDTPILVLLEDLDKLISDDDRKSMWPSVLEGVTHVSNTVFVATTNYPEKLPAEFINRPGRFDVRIKVGAPDRAARRSYLQHLTRDLGCDLDLEAIVEQTDGLTFAHLKEVVCNVVIYGRSLEEAVRRVRKLEKPVRPVTDTPSPLVGFIESNGSG